jgi:hypothetical protein
MSSSDPYTALALAKTRARELHAEAAAARLREPPRRARQMLASCLRRAADRLDPVPFSRRPAKVLDGAAR